MDSVKKPKILRIYLKVSKCDQFGHDIDIFLGRTESPCAQQQLHYHTWQSVVQHQVFSFIFRMEALLRRANLSQLSEMY